MKKLLLAIVAVLILLVLVAFFGPVGLSAEEVTIAELLSDAGYATHHIGTVNVKKR